MNVTEIICEYIYGSFLIIKNALDVGISAAKGVLKLIDSVVVAALNTLLYSMNPMINTIINLVKVYQKKLVDIIFGKSDDHIWCHRLFDCLALLNELIDPNSFIFRMIKKIWKRECHSVIDDDLIEQIHDWIQNFDDFRVTICKYGFTFEFGISLIREILNQFKKQIEGFIKWCTRKKDELLKQLESYLDFCISTGIIDELEKLMDFFLCVLDSSESCASIATASSYYSSAMSTLKLEKQGEGYGISTEYKNKIVGGLEGAKIRCSNVKYDIECLCNAIVNPDEVERANNAYNLSKNLFPANMKWSDFTKEDGSFSIGKVFSSDTWHKSKVYQTAIQVKNDFVKTVSKKKKNPEDELNLKELINGTFIDPYGHMYYKDGCDYIQLDDLNHNTEITSMDIYINDNANTNSDVLLDPDTNELISVTYAAVKIAQNPDSGLADRCKTVWSFVNNWQMNADVIVRGDNILQPI